MKEIMYGISEVIEAKSNKQEKRHAFLEIIVEFLALIQLTDSKFLIFLPLLLKVNGCKKRPWDSYTIHHQIP